MPAVTSQSFVIKIPSTTKGQFLKWLETHGTLKSENVVDANLVINIHTKKMQRQDCLQRSLRTTFQKNELPVNNVRLQSARKTRISTDAATTTDDSSFELEGIDDETEEEEDVKEVAHTGNNLVDSMVAEHGGQILAEMRTSDGFVNATKMCKAGGKKWHDYIRGDDTKKFMAAFKAGYPALKNLVISQHGGNHAGTWVHPQVAVHLASWISPVFAVAVTNLVIRYASGSVTTEESQAASAALADKIKVAQNARLPFTLRSFTNRIDMRSAQVYLRQVPGKFTNLHPKGRPDLVLSEEEMKYIIVIKAGCMGQTTRQTQHQTAFKDSELLDSLHTLMYTHVEQQAKDLFTDRGMLYEGMHESKKVKDTELLVVRSQEEYDELVKMLQTIVSNNAPGNEASSGNTTSVLIEQEKTKQIVAQSNASVRVKELDLQIVLAQIRLLELQQKT